MRPVRVSIAYCQECGYQPYAFQLAEALVNEFQLLLSAVEIVPWVNGAFDVRVDGELVHSMYRDGGVPETARIIAAVRERIGAPS
ncbi:MAG TPA: Rdx family protein [Isosphaeraceae bacterium]|jgi:selenoprotein W-related protein|nr:Rdx family protein [Isosphaeraceae bacterium]